MTLKICPSCGKTNTTKNADFIGRGELGVHYLAFNCECKSTFIILSKQDKEKLNGERSEERKAG